MPKRSDIVAAARSYLGVPWQHLGRSRQGLDCIGLVVRVFQDTGIPVEDQRNYTRGPQVQNFRAVVNAHTTRGTMAYIRPGQIGVFKQEQYPMHVGVIGMDNFGQLTLIHAAAGNRRVVEVPLREWQHDLIDVREVPGIED